MPYRMPSAHYGNCSCLFPFARFADTVQWGDCYCANQNYQPSTGDFPTFTVYQMFAMMATNNTQTPYMMCRDWMNQPNRVASWKCSTKYLN